MEEAGVPMEEDGAEEEACTALSAEAQQLSALMAAAQPLPPPLALDAEPPAGAPQHPQALWLRCGEAFCGVMSYVGEGGRLSLAHVALFAASEPPVPWGRSRHAVHALLSERAQSALALLRSRPLSQAELLSRLLRWVALQGDVFTAPPRPGLPLLALPPGAASALALVPARALTCCDASALERAALACG